MTKESKDILVVEDSPVQAETLRRLLSENGYKVIVAKNGAEGLEAIMKKRPNLIISDILMPVMDGYQFCEKIKENEGLKDIPVLLLTQLIEPEEVISGLESGADNYLTKPFNEAFLLSKVNSLLENPDRFRNRPDKRTVEFEYDGKLYEVYSGRAQTLSYLISTYENAVLKTKDLEKAQEELRTLNESLEKKVEERTAELKSINDALKAEITERKKAEEELYKSEERYRSLISNIPDVTWTADSKGNTVFISPNVKKIYGYTPEEIYRDPYNLWFGRIHPDDIGPVRESFELLFSKNKEFDVEYRIQRKDGEWIWFHDRAMNTYEKDGAAYADGIFSDITERRKLEEQLRHSQKLEAIGQLVGGIAHDFNNILTAVIGFGGIMQMKLRKEDPLTENVEQILEAAERGANMTQSLLIFGRKQAVKLAPVDINEIIEKVDKLLSRLIGENMELRILTAKRELPVMADSVQIGQVLINLATNARDAMPAGGELTIETVREKVDKGFVKAHGYGEPGEYALISVSDTGVGMEEDTKRRIFEPFFTTKEVGKGTGLGLSIVYGIVKQHNGYINVYSEVGKGTTFRIYLPLVRKTAEEKKTQEAPVPIVGSETVLVAEDDSTVRKLSKTLLETFGYKVIEAVDGEEAVQKFMENKDKIRLLILDVMMPRKNGKEAYEEIKKTSPEIRTLFMSGYTADVIQTKWIMEKGLDFISKPMSNTEFMRKVREVLDR